MAKCNQLTALPFKGLTDKLALTGERSCTYSACHCTARVASAYSLTVWCLSFIWCGSYRFRRLNVYRLFAVINVQTCSLILLCSDFRIPFNRCPRLNCIHFIPIHQTLCVLVSINAYFTHTHIYVYRVSKKLCKFVFVRNSSNIYLDANMSNPILIIIALCNSLVHMRLTRQCGDAN